MQSDVVDASWVQLLAAHHSCGKPRSRLLSFAAAAHQQSTAARLRRERIRTCGGMVRIALCWARATDRREDAEREGCAAGLVPGTEDVTLEVDVDLATCDFAALVAAAGAQLPPRHRAVAFHFQGKAIGPGSAPLGATACGAATHCGPTCGGSRSSSRGRGRLTYKTATRRSSATTGRGSNIFVVV